MKRTLVGPALWLVPWLCAPSAHAQQNTPDQRIQAVQQALERTEAQLAATEQQLNQLRLEVSSLKQQMTEGAKQQSAASGQATSGTDVEELRERQAIADAQIATHEQAKVESDSKYSVKITGLILATGFVNTRAADIPLDPTITLSGPGSTGLSLRQTILGLDASGPHLWGATSRADSHVDFFGNPMQGTSTDSGGLARLRTAHAALDWQNAELAFAYDRPLISPNAPTSLVSVAEPALAWSGNLWNWAPQVSTTFKSDHLRASTALIDAPDPPTGAPSTAQSSLAEASRWPGVEARISVVGLLDPNHVPSGYGPSRFEAGLGGYVSPHRASDGTRFNAWASTFDLRTPLPARFGLSGSFYRGQALGGLGGGGYKDYVSRTDNSLVTIRVPDDIGGWAQLKQQPHREFEWNIAYGIDDVFARQLRPYVIPGDASFAQALARNRTLSGNVIYSPRTYLMFSVEYRRLASTNVSTPTSTGDIFGLGAGYQF
jgi:hypothetical protein